MENLNIQPPVIIQKRLGVNKHYGCDPLLYFRFKEYFERNPQKKTYNIMYGYDYINSTIMEDAVNVIVDFEEPNFFTLRGDIRIYIDFTKKCDVKVTMCPFSANYFNQRIGREVVKSTFYPTDILQIEESLGVCNINEKTNTAIYIGIAGLSNIPITQELMKRSTYNKPLEQTYVGKFEALYKSKIAICINLLLYIPENMYIRNNLISDMPEIVGNNNDGFSIPQLKSRVFEAGFAKCIPLVYYDQYKIVEQYFTPNVDFIYFNTMDELDILIKEIEYCYDDYKHIAENVYKKCMENYTLEHFIERYIIQEY